MKVSFSTLRISAKRILEGGRRLLAPVPVVSSILTGVISALIASIVFTYWDQDRIQDIAFNRVEAGKGIIGNRCATILTYDLKEGRLQFDRYYQLHRMPGVPDPVVEDLIDALTVLGDRDPEAYTLISHLSNFYKDDLRNYIFNDDRVRQWRAEDYWIALDYVCHWAGYQVSGLCAVNDEVHYNIHGRLDFGAAEAYGTMACHSSALYSTYKVPDLD